MVDSLYQQASELIWYSFSDYSNQYNNLFYYRYLCITFIATCNIHLFPHISTKSTQLLSNITSFWLSGTFSPNKYYFLSRMLLYLTFSMKLQYNHARWPQWPSSAGLAGTLVMNALSIWEHFSSHPLTSIQQVVDDLMSLYHSKLTISLLNLSQKVLLYFMISIELIILLQSRG